MDYALDYTIGRHNTTCNAKRRYAVKKTNDTEPMENYADIILLALIAAFIILRLRSILGRTDDEDMINQIRQKAEQQQKTATAAAEQKQTGEMKDITDQVKQERDEAFEALDPALKEQVAAVKNTDRTFSLTDFLQGANMAFEMIVTALAQGDKDTLRDMLSPDLYESFAAEIDRRKEANEHHEVTLVSLKGDLTSADIEDKTALLSVNFTSEQICVVKDPEDNIVSGSTDHIDELRDHWTFARDITSSNPNWQLAATDGE